MGVPRLGTPGGLKPAGCVPSVGGVFGRRRLAVVVAVIVVLTALGSLQQTVNYLRGGVGKDYPLWYATGQKVLAGEQLYPVGQVFPFMYPPVAAVLLAPLSVFGLFPMMLILAAINSAAWVASVLLSVYLVTGRAFGGHPLLYLLPALCSVPFAYDTYHLGQVNLILLAVMLGAFACLRNGREWGAGALVALAAGIKVFPIMAAGYFVYRRQWVALVSLCVSLLLLFVAVPFAVRGPEQGAEDLRVWAGGMLLKYDEGSVGQRTGRAYSWKNQSVVGVANRLLRHNLADEDPATGYYINVAELGFRTTNAVIVGFAAALCLFYVTAMPRRAARTPQTDAIEYAMLLLLILLFSPYSFGYFFVWWLYPVAVLVHLWLSAPASSPDSRRLGAVFAAVVILPSLTLVDQRTAEAYGNFFLTTLLLLGTLGWQLHKSQRGATGQPDGPVAPQPIPLAG